MNHQQELITDKSIQLFGQYGVKSVTMNDVAIACGMSKKTIYLFFENKDQLIQTVIAQLTTNYTQSYNDIRNTCPTALEEVLASIDIMDTAFRQINHRLVSEIQKYYYNIWKKIDMFRDNVVLDFIKSNLKRGQEQGYFHQCFDNEIIAAMRLRELNALHSSYEGSSQHFRLHEILTQVSMHYLAGICTPKGMQLLKKKYKTIYPSKAEAQL